MPIKSLVHTEELCSWSVPLEHFQGAKSLVCIGLLIMTEENVFNKQELLVHGHHFFYCHDCLTDSAVTF